MPLQNMSADPGQDYFSDGLTSDLTTDLTRIRNILVLAASTSFTFKGKPVDVATIHRDYGVRYIIEGSVEQVSGRVRVNVQLIDAESGVHLWAMRFDRERADIFAVQDEILGAVVDKLEIKLSEEERKRVLAQSTSDVEAYNLFIKGRDLFENGTSRADNVAAQALFQQALARDPTMASAKAYESRAYVKEWRHNWWQVSEQDSLDKAYQTAVTAVKLGPDNEDAHGSLAIAYLVKGEYPQALQEYDTSTRLSGDHVNPDMTAEIGFAYVYMNREPEGIAKLEEAMKANPVHPWWYESALGWAYYQNHQYSDAVRVLTSVKEDVNDLRMTLAASYARLGEMDKAKSTMAEYLKNETWTIADEAGAPFVDPNDEKHWLDGLRMAGMPEGEGKTTQP
jgi:TolB-like protein